MQLIASFRLQSSRVISRTSAFPSSQLRMIQVGEVAPDFELKNSEGKSFKLSSFKGKKNVVVFFYPSDNTPGCTTEVCAFEKKFPDFSKLDTVVFGISSNPAADKEKFLKATKTVNTQLLIDNDSKIRQLWNVPKVLGIIPGRVTYIVDKQGKVTYVFDDLANAAKHPDRVLEKLAADNVVVASSPKKFGLF